MAEMKPVDERLPQRLTANRIRSVYLPIVWRGYHPRAVRELLALVADEILRLHQRLAAAYAETARLRRRLVALDSTDASACRRGGYLDRTGQSTRDRWPINRS